MSSLPRCHACRQLRDYHAERSLVNLCERCNEILRPYRFARLDPESLLHPANLTGEKGEEIVFRSPRLIMKVEEKVGKTPEHWKKDGHYPPVLFLMGGRLFSGQLHRRMPEISPDAWIVTGPIHVVELPSHSNVSAEGCTCEECERIGKLLSKVLSYPGSQHWEAKLHRDQQRLIDAGRRFLNDFGDVSHEDPLELEPSFIGYDPRPPTYSH